MRQVVIDSSVLIDAVVYVRPKALERIISLYEAFIPVDLNTQIFEISYLFSEIYGLFPNDALIAATCKHHGIRKIATFDPDFKRVDFLEMLELEEE